MSPFESVKIIGKYQVKFHGKSIHVNVYLLSLRKKMYTM